MERRGAARIRKEGCHNEQPPKHDHIMNSIQPSNPLGPKRGELRCDVWE